MNNKTDKLLVVESGEDLRERIVAALNDAGCQVSTDAHEGMKAVHAFEPDLVILGADPPRLDCCDLLSEIKGSENTRNIRVLMLSPGGSAERTRGLDLGADDVLSLPRTPRVRPWRKRCQVHPQASQPAQADERMFRRVSVLWTNTHNSSAACLRRLERSTRLAAHYWFFKHQG